RKGRVRTRPLSCRKALEQVSQPVRLSDRCGACTAATHAGGRGAGRNASANVRTAGYSIPREVGGGSIRIRNGAGGGKKAVSFRADDGDGAAGKPEIERIERGGVGERRLTRMGQEVVEKAIGLDLVGRLTRQGGKPLQVFGMHA